MSLFEQAKPSAERLKMLVYGETGTGKTVTSLHFPNPVVIDTERGTEHYGSHFDFYRLKTANPDKIMEALEELLEDPQEYKTLVIDSITVLYDAIVDKQLSRMKLKTGNPNYEIKPLDYKFIKADVKSIVQSVLALDMNVIVTAHSKTLYSQEEFMKILGATPDGPKELPYMFDVVLRLTGEDGKFIAEVDKDRTNKLPRIGEQFEFTYQAFTNYIGIEGLERAPVVFRQTEALNQRAGRATEIEFEGATMFTAGITAEILGALQEFAATDEKLLAAKLHDDYMVTSVLDLRADEATMLLNDLKTTQT